MEGSTDAGLKAHITDVKTYKEYRDWAGKVKSSNGIGAAGQQAVMASPQAWLSFALKTDKLINKTIVDGDLKVEKFEPATENCKYDFTVGVDEIEIGNEASTEHLKKVFGIEGGAFLDSLSAENVDITFRAPSDGKVKFSAGPNAKNANEKIFFMKVKMTP